MPFTTRECAAVHSAAGAVCTLHTRMLLNERTPSGEELGLNCVYYLCQVSIRIGLYDLQRAV